MTHRLHVARALLIVAANLVGILAVARPALAADASPWDGDQRGAMRLIAAAQRGSGNAAIYRAGVEVRLAPGWKTYWRYPGDSGVPPRFDFAGSQNVKSVTVRYPAPHRFTDESGTSIGYKTNVVFPLDIVPADPAKPVRLALKLDYALCEKICIPDEGKAELDIDGKQGALDGELTNAEAHVPVAAPLGDMAAFAVRAVTREGKRIVVDVARPDGATVELFAEGPTADWALPVPEPVAGPPAGQQRFAFDIDGLPPGAKPDGAEIRLTAVSPDRAIEVPYRLD
jgi:DsbC/DsbD-like thiol-disulfide interchange protein